MSRYRVTFWIREQRVAEVDADNEEEAMDIAADGPPGERAVSGTEQVDDGREMRVEKIS